MLSCNLAVLPKLRDMDKVDNLSRRVASSLLLLCRILTPLALKGLFILYNLERIIPVLLYIISVYVLLTFYFPIFVNNSFIIESFKLLWIKTPPSKNVVLLTSFQW